MVSMNVIEELNSKLIKLNAKIESLECSNEQDNQ